VPRKTEKAKFSAILEFGRDLGATRRVLFEKYECFVSCNDDSSVDLFVTVPSKNTKGLVCLSFSGTIL
jgi:hypothetical protein